MGSLIPGATYTYTKIGGVTYAQTEGQEPFEIGRDYDIKAGDVNAVLEEAKLWMDIRTEARTNVALQNALDHAIMIYRLSKDKPL